MDGQIYHFSVRSFQILSCFFFNFSTSVCFPEMFFGEKTPAVVSLLRI